MDDFNIHNVTWEAHLNHICMVLQRLRDVNLKLNPNKCIFSINNIILLGLVVGKLGTHLDPNKVKAIVEFPIPKTFTNIQAFLGLTRYYQNYIQRYAKIATPLFELTKQDIAFQWNLDYQKAFDQLKHALVSAPILARLNFCKASILNVD